MRLETARRRFDSRCEAGSIANTIPIKIPMLTPMAVKLPWRGVVEPTHRGRGRTVTKSR
jgi:hypothetical protein